MKWSKFVSKLYLESRICLFCSSHLWFATELWYNVFLLNTVSILISRVHLMCSGLHRYSCEFILSYLQRVTILCYLFVECLKSYNYFSRYIAGRAIDLTFCLFHMGSPCDWILHGSRRDTLILKNLNAFNFIVCILVQQWNIGMVRGVVFESHESGKYWIA